MKKIKKIMAGMLIICLIVTNMPLQTLMATDSNITAVSEEPEIIHIEFETYECIDGVTETAVGRNEETGNWDVLYQKYTYWPDCVITFQDGTVVDAENGFFEYNGNGYCVLDYCTDDQSPTNSWGLGQHIVNVDIFGYQTSFAVTVVENPIVSIECESLVIVEGTSGYIENDYDDETGEIIGEYYRYDLYPTFTVTLADGTVVSDLQGHFLHEGNMYPLTWEDDQGCENQWTAGNTYTATAELLGRYDEFEITIVEADDSGETGGTDSPEDEQIFVGDAFEFNISTDDQMVAGNEVTLEIDVTNKSDQVLSSLSWFTHWYYQVSGNSDDYPGVEFGILADDEGNILDGMENVDIAFAVDETRTFTLTGVLPETWGSQSVIALVIGCEVGQTLYYGQEEFSGCSSEDSSGNVVDKQTGTVMIGSATGIAGQEVTVSLSFEEEVSIKSIAISRLSYDSSKLELIDGEWGLNGVIADWGGITEGQGVLTFAKNMLVEGSFFTFTFRILDDIEDCEIPITCQITAKEILDTQEEIALDIETIAGKIEVINAIYGDYDGNGILTSDDAIYLLYHILMPEQCPIYQNPDYDGNGVVNSDDAIQLLYNIMLPEEDDSTDSGSDNPGSGNTDAEEDDEETGWGPLF